MTENIISNILHELCIRPTNAESFKIFISSLKTILEHSSDKNLISLSSWNAPLLPNLNRLDSQELEFIESKLKEINIPINQCQIIVQKIIPQPEKKRYAVYYTNESALNFMKSLVAEYLKINKDRKIVLSDPFLGSGLTLSTVVKEIDYEIIQMIWGIEPLSLPAFVAYASLLSAVKGKRDIINVIVGDAFEELPLRFLQSQNSDLKRADIILTNPPFTRWNNLENSYREYLHNRMTNLGYKKYIVKREVSLQTLSMFLVDHALKENGLIVSILPASTFYTIYGRGYKDFLKKQYHVYALLVHESEPSLSEGSRFKEILLVAEKQSKINRNLTVVTKFDGSVEDIVKNIICKEQPKSVANTFNLNDLPAFLDKNWLSLFEETDIRNILLELFKTSLKKGTLKPWEQVLGKNSILRGLEMYGSEFFFIPNKYWQIINENSEFVEIKNIQNKFRLKIYRDFLIKSLRKPSLNSNKIEVNLDSFVLSIPPIDLNYLPQDLQEYIRWGIESGTASPSMRFHRKYWFSHIYRQITTKKPFGHLFLPDKIDSSFKQTGIFASYCKEKVTASKNFHIIKEYDKLKVKILSCWFNSTFFISMLLLFGRRISHRWTRFLKNDYFELPIIDLNKVNRKYALELYNNFDNIVNKPLPPLRQQLNEEFRFRNDLLIAKSIGLDNPEEIINRLYYALLNKSSFY